MSDLTVKLIVAAVAAIAVIVAALIGLWKDRKGRREILLQDLEILAKLPSPSLNHMTLAGYIDKRILLLSLEDKIGLMVFTVGTMAIAIVLLVIAIVVGVVTGHLLWSALATVVLLVVAGLLIAYRVSKETLRDRLEKRMKETARETTTQYVRENYGDKIRDQAIKKYESKFPPSAREELMSNLTPYVDTAINETVDRIVNSLVSDNRYSGWSPTISSKVTLKERTAILKVNFYAALLRMADALQSKLSESNERVTPSAAEEIGSGSSADTQRVPTDTRDAQGAQQTKPQVTNTRGAQI